MVMGHRSKAGTFGSAACLPVALVVDPSRELSITISPLTEQVGKEQCWCWSITDGDKTISVNEQQLRMVESDVPQGKL